MAFIEVENIKIEYDVSIDDIARIEEIIKLNSYLFTDYKGKTIVLNNAKNIEFADIIYVTDFDKFFDNLLKRLLEDQNIILALDFPDLLPALYIQLLINDASQEEKTILPLKDSITDDLLWFSIASKFYDYKTEFSKLSNFLKYREDKERIVTWLRETQRFKTYNYLLKIAANYLKEHDLAFLDNMEEIVLKMNGESIDSSLSLYKESKYLLPEMSLKELEQFFLDYLNYIGAPEQWKNIYYELKQANCILFAISYDGYDHSEVFIDDDGRRKIRVTNDGTIKVFVSFVHEFMHYVSLQKDTPPFSLFELPSIYYEKVAANYLISLGYDEDIIREVIRERKQNNLDIYRSISGILLDICQFNQNGPITKEDKIAAFKEVMELLNEVKQNMLKLCIVAGEPLDDEDIPEYNYSEIVDKECDDNIMRFINNGLLALNGYQYLIDSYLVDKILEKDDTDTLNKMIFVTASLAEFNIEKIINYLGIDNPFTLKFKNLESLN